MTPEQAKKLNVGDLLIVTNSHPPRPFSLLSAKEGFIARVTSIFTDTYLYIKWVTPTTQQDGGYYPEHFELFKKQKVPKMKVVECKDYQKDETQQHIGETVQVMSRGKNLYVCRCKDGNILTFADKEIE